MMKKTAIITIFSVCFFTTIIAAANEYKVSWVELVTRTLEDNTVESVFWFDFLELDSLYLIDNIVESVTITTPDGSKISKVPTYIEWQRTEFRGQDHNSNGIIDIDMDEYTPRTPHSAMEYEIIASNKPHLAGNYSIDIVCKNGQHLNATGNVTAGLSQPDLFGVTDIVARFDQSSGLLNVSWTPPISYPKDTVTEVRLKRFDSNGNDRHIMYRVRELPASTTSHTFFQWESNAIRQFSAYIQLSIYVKTKYEGEGVIASSSHAYTTQEYRVENYNLIPTEIPSQNQSSDFATVNSDLSIQLPNTKIGETFYELKLNPLEDSESPLGYHWELDIDSFSVKYPSK